MNLRRLFTLIALIVLSGCGAEPVTQTNPPPTETVRAVTATPSPPTITATTDWEARLMETATAAAATRTAASFQPIPAPDGPMPGWVWYDYGDLRFAYPEVWQVSTEYGLRFSSLETNTLISVMAWNYPRGMNWLNHIRQDDDHLRQFVYARLAPEDVTVNARIQGQDAFFHVLPAHPGLGDTATLLFEYRQQIYRFYLHAGAVVPPLDAEAQVFQAMLASIRLNGQGDLGSDIPTGWEEQEVLIQVGDSDAFSSAGEVVEVEGVLENVQAEPGSSLRAILRQDGQPYSIMLVSEYQFQGQSLGVGASGVPFGLHDGMSVRVIGVAAPPLDLRPYVWYVRGSRDWEPVSYRSFFDLTHDTPDPAILALYPENAVLWLYGPAERVTPYLIPPERVGFAPDPGEVALVRGRLQSADPPRILFDEIYLLNGECQPPILPDQRQWPCTTWEEVYPGYFPIQFQARVRRVDAERGIVVFEEPVRGFITLTVNPDLPVGGENGAQTPLSDLTRGTLIAVTGIPGEAGAIVGGCLATQALAP